MDRKFKIYNFGPDGRDACWAALSHSWSQCPRQQDVNTEIVWCDSTGCSDVEAQFKDTSISQNSRSVNPCRTVKKKNPCVMTMASLSPRPQPLPPSSPRALKCKSGTQQRSTLTNNQPSSSVKVVKQTISEPPTINDPYNCSQSGYLEVSGVTGNNNNNDDDDNKNNQKYGVLETIDAVNQNQQPIMCAADSGLLIDIKEPATVDVEKPVKCAPHNGGGDCISSMSCPPTPSTATEQPIEYVQHIEPDNVSSMSCTPTLSTAVEQPIEHVPQIEADNVVSLSCTQILSTAVDQPIEPVHQIEGDNISFISCSPTPSTDAELSIESEEQIEADNVSSMSYTPTLSTAVEQPIEHVPQIKDDNVSSMSCPPTLSTTAEQPIEHVSQIEDDNVSSMSCPPTLSTTAEQPIEHVPQIEGDNVSSMSCLPTLSTTAEQPIEPIQQIESDGHILSVFCPPTPSTAVEKTMTAEKSVIVEVVVGCHVSCQVSSVLSPQFPLMTSTTDDENPMDVTVASQSPQPQPKDEDEYLVQSNTDMMVFSDKPLSKYEMKIKEIDNNIISYSKSFLSTVLFVVLLRVLF